MGTPKNVELWKSKTIGGLKEKVYAAYRAGIKTIVIPKDNEKDLDEISENIKDKITFVSATSMETVLKTALVKNVFVNNLQYCYF